MARLLHWYPMFDEQFVLYQLPMIRGWAYYAASTEADGWLGLNGVQRLSDGYIGGEVKNLVAIAKEAMKK